MMSPYSRFTRLAAGSIALMALASAGEAQRYSRSSESYSIPPVTLVERNGRPVPLASVLGHKGPVLVQFIFSTCSAICPLMSGSFTSFQEQLGDGWEGVRLISISIDPEHDTPARLREYAAKVKAGAQWQFLTGKEEDIVAVQQAFNVYRGPKMRHEPVTFLRASPRTQWVRLEGLMSASELISEYHRAVGH
jgi:protein SCO1